MKKLIILSVLLLISLAIAQASELNIVESQIYINGELESSFRNNTTYSEIIEPGDEIDFEIEVENTFKDDRNINNIVISAAIFNITQGIDLIENTSSFDLSNDQSKTKKIKFEIPRNADELIKKVLFVIEGKDKKGNTHKIERVLYISIEDEDHEIVIKKAILNQTTYSCNPANLIVLIENKGSYDEGDVNLKVYNEQLGLDKEYKPVRINKDVIYTKNIPIFFDSSVKSGKYNIVIESYYKESHLDDIQAIPIYIEKCKITSEEEIVSEEGSNDSDGLVNNIVNSDSTTDINNQITSIKPEDNINNRIIFIAILFVFILLAIIIVLFFYLLRK
jgi:hypothetical protein